MAGPNTSYVPRQSDDQTQKIESGSPKDDIEIGTTAQLRTIHIGRLSDGDREEADNLSKAAQEDGFFYLDLQASSFAEMLHAVDHVFCLSKELFGLRREEKMVYDVDKLSELKLNGYLVLRSSAPNTRLWAQRPSMLIKAAQIQARWP